MAQFDVVRNVNPDTRRVAPLLLEVQSDFLSELSTRVVVPLITAKHFGRPASRLNPTFDVVGLSVVMSTAELAGIPKSELGEKVDSLSQARDQIIAALDFAVQGF